jgi:hypothetical protein
MTPREFSRAQAAAAEIARRESERDLFLCWQTGAFVAMAWIGKLPSWQSIQMKAQLRSGTQSLEDMTAQLKTLSHLTGFPLREVKH